MTDVKRSLADFSDTLDSDNHEDKRPHAKPGRKPLDTEPKSKRTAQNRAAQRAYRERKERKMKDLEDKVNELEDAKIKAATETDFLRAQVNMLKKELAKYNSGGLLSEVSPDERTIQRGVSGTGLLGRGSFSRGSGTITAEFPWASENLGNWHKQGNQLPDLVSGSSSSTSPLDENVLISPSITEGSTEPSSGGSFEPVKIGQGFDEQLDSFCASLGEACGTRDNLIPKAKANLANSPPYSNILSPFSKTKDTPSEQQPFSPDFNFNFDLTQGDNILASLSNNNNFDVSLAFDDKDENFGLENNIDNLVNEESVYDQLKNPINLDFNFNDFVKNSLPPDNSPFSSDTSGSTNATSVATGAQVGNEEEDDDVNIVVPKPEETLKCSEVWERVTSHPRYSDIDIDGLCSELKDKAKCSDQAVVLNASDVNSLLQESMLRSKTVNPLGF